ncbi:hypothetical protein QJS66_22600 [Kocuria rhizophila]|nr:hypothetical protein QJS66_22600 [Kocuria rhizophila]
MSAAPCPRPRSGSRRTRARSWSGSTSTPRDVWTPGGSNGCWPSARRRLRWSPVMWANDEVGDGAAGGRAGHPVQRRRCPSTWTRCGRAVSVNPRLPGSARFAVSAHKLGGPSRGWAPYAPAHRASRRHELRRRTSAASARHGQRRRRGSSGAAVEAAQRRFRTSSCARATLRDALVAGVRERVPEAVLREPEPGGPAEEWEHPARLPGNARVTFPRVEAAPCCSCSTPPGWPCPPAGVQRRGAPGLARARHGRGRRTARGAQRFSLATPARRTWTPGPRRPRGRPPGPARQGCPDVPASFAS